MDSASRTSFETVERIRQVAAAGPNRHFRVKQGP
jgi:hypothetical protein